MPREGSWVGLGTVQKYVPSSFFRIILQCFIISFNEVSIYLNHEQIIVSQNEPVQWTTPLGLPVVQPYRILGTHSVRASVKHSVTLTKCQLYFKSVYF